MNSLAGKGWVAAAALVSVACSYSSEPEGDLCDVAQRIRDETGACEVEKRCELGYQTGCWSEALQGGESAWLWVGWGDGFDAPRRETVLIRNDRSALWVHEEHVNGGVACDVEVLAVYECRLEPPDYFASLCPDVGNDGCIVDEQGWTGIEHWFVSCEPGEVRCL